MTTSCGELAPSEYSSNSLLAALLIRVSTGVTVLEEAVRFVRVGPIEVGVPLDGAVLSADDTSVLPLELLRTATAPLAAPNERSAIQGC
jgi:hypothetical protein